MKKYLPYLAALFLLYLYLPACAVLPSIDKATLNQSNMAEKISKSLDAGRNNILGQQDILNNRLFKAVRNNDVKEAKAALKDGANINARLKPGILPDSYKDMTPLCLAAYDKNAKMVRFLIDGGADPNAFDFIGFTPLVYAVYGYNKPVDISIVKALLLAKADPNAPTPYHYTPLMKAAEQDLPAVMEMLISFGADVNAKSKIGFTPIDLAADSRQANNIGILLRHGSKLPEMEVLKAFALETAVTAVEKDTRPDNKEITLMLLKKGVDPNIDFYDGSNALLSAVLLNRFSMVSFLLENGADVNKADNFGFTPLMAAALQGNTDIINLLLEYGADKNKKDSEGKTALDYAIESKNRNSAAILK